MSERHVTVSADMVKSAYILKETDRGNSINPPAAATQILEPPAMPPQSIDIPHIYETTRRNRKDLNVNIHCFQNPSKVKLCL